MKIAKKTKETTAQKIDRLFPSLRGVKLVKLSEEDQREFNCQFAKLVQPEVNLMEAWKGVCGSPLTTYCQK